MASSARIDELRKKFDENPRRYFAPLANEYRKAGDAEQAIFICQEYLPQQPGHMSGHIVYGQALYELGRHDEAKAVFETALSLDPENLIALRHLGDIARQAADTAAARIWYQRVLEADPRNEEIAQIMMTLLAEPSGGALSDNRPTPIVVAVVEPAAGETTPDASVVQLADEAAQAAEMEPPEISASDSIETPRTTQNAQHVPMPDAGEQPVRPSHELLDLDDFSIGGVPLISEEATAVEQAESAATGPMASSDEEEETGGFNLGEEDGPFEEDPLAIAATRPASETSELSAEPPDVADIATEWPAEPATELAADIRLGLSTEADAEIPEPALEPLAELEPEAAAEDGGEQETVVIDGFEAFEPGIVAPESEMLAGLEPETTFESPPSEPAPATQAPVASSALDEDAALPTVTFVTETMAELYLQQGHLESALDIYTKLVEQRPDDAALRERRRVIEERLYGKPAVPPTVVLEMPEPIEAVEATEAAEAPEATETPEAMEAAELAAAPVAAAPAYEGPTIREFLNTLLAGRVPATDVVPPPAPRATPSSSETVSGSIDALFSGAEAAMRDDAAVAALSEAFAPEATEATEATEAVGPAEPEPAASQELQELQGQPAHRAADELSLDHVFRSNTPPRGAEPVDGFSFDQFFADSATESAPGGSGTRDTSGGAPPDDIEQFNAWLNGLKKT